MKKAFLAAFAATFFLAGCQALGEFSGKVQEYTGLTQVEQICLAREVAETNGYDVAQYDAQLAVYGVVCEE